VGAFEGFGFLIPALVLGPVVGLLTLAQVLLVRSRSSRPGDDDIAARYRKVTSLAIVTVLLSLGALLVCMLVEEIQFSFAVNLVLHQPDEVMILTPALAEVYAYHGWAGGAVALVGLVGIACVGLLWLRHRRRGPLAATGLWIVVGAGLAAAFIGGVWAIRQGLMSVALSKMTLADTSEKRILFSLAVEGLPSMGWGLWPAAAALLAAFSAAALRPGAEEAKRANGAWLLPIGLIVLVLGGAAVLATRGYARDADERLRALVGGPYVDYADTQCRGGDVLWGQAEILLPELPGGRPLEQAQVVTVGRNSVSLEGKQVNADRLDDEGGGLADLTEVLSMLKGQYQQIHGVRSFPGGLILQADVRAQGTLIASVLASARTVGYARPMLVFRKAIGFQSHVYGELMRAEESGLPIALADGDDPMALRPDETLGRWIERSKLRARADADTVIRVRAPD